MSDDQTPATPSTDKLSTMKMIITWGIVSTLVFIVVVFGIAFLTIAIRGGTMPSTDVFATVVKTLADILLAIIGK
jgi:multidrug resistance efflux pump